MEFPATRRCPLVRTASDTGEGPWNELLGIITPAVFDVVTEDLFGDWPVDRVVAFALEDGVAERHPLLFVVDERTLTDHGFPVVAADLRDEPGRTLRIAAIQLWSVGTDVPHGAVEFAAYADQAQLQPDRVFRGFG
ncbi:MULTISPECIES: DUF6924 domain-containing protein [Pseudonocardia]|uniref:DUF6924 domain-containing protein n=2 Tax=Pseudonocardia TaxID=1847 RepID=A0A1Y2N3W4_PSEAH|nr:MULTISPECIES: hypothetical protein [Pseudonocardia]OSY42150.1 hypothetical protein BG845_01648 [Pseudonocardia autotrophica]TDN75082.1 hypothetical protein C8E95_4223 [Pseudonocardia autotrophica]BBF99026.1 hypothetical protein Pdca_02360 [Pseudonocardia autotrophica]GEC23946.1 hypothetical protein PSA01_09750 [Pseudonocardia saturnea]